MLDVIKVDFNVLVPGAAQQISAIMTVFQSHRQVDTSPEYLIRFPNRWHDAALQRLWFESYHTR